jgi:hypothetical protein
LASESCNAGGWVSILLAGCFSSNAQASSPFVTHVNGRD